MPKRTGASWTGVDLRNAALLAVVCAVFMVLRWKKMDSLLWLDPAHWLNEIARFARGEIPYRDFSFQYPPFVVFLYGWLLRIFGARFMTVQVITDLIDLGVIACCYALIRKLLPRALHLAVGFLLVVTCATSLMNFNVFSYVTYTPSLQTGAMGVLLVGFALASYIHDGAWRWSWLVLAALGGFIGVLSKPESALACVLAISAFGLVVRKPRVTAMTAALVFLPAMAAYAFVANLAGFQNLVAGMSGYGLATAFCPWWPTGLGTFGVVAAIGEAAALTAILTLPRRRNFDERFGTDYRRFLRIAPLGALAFAAYIFYQTRGALLEPGLAAAERVRRIIPYLIYSTPVLEPVVWVCVAAFCVLAWRVKRTANRLDAQLLIFVSAPVAMSSRAIFSSTQNVYPEVAGICYPFLLVLGPYFLWRFLKTAGESYAAAVVGVLVLGYAVVRIAGGWPELLSDRYYGTLKTEAGTVKLLNYATDSKVYDYVMSHTSPQDYLLDLPYGGGLNFATGRRCPIFNVQLAGLGVPPRYEQLDLDLVRKNPPRMVIASDEPHLGTYWGFGLKGNRACPCPKLVWIPQGRSWDPDHVFPVVSYIEDHYRVAEKIGNRVIWIPRIAAASAQSGKIEIPTSCSSASPCTGHGSTI